MHLPVITFNKIHEYHHQQNSEHIQQIVKTFGYSVLILDTLVYSVWFFFAALCK